MRTVPEAVFFSLLSAEGQPASRNQFYEFEATHLYLRILILTVPEAVFKRATAWSCLALLKSESLTLMIWSPLINCPLTSADPPTTCNLAMFLALEVKPKVFSVYRISAYSFHENYSFLKVENVEIFI